MATCSRKARFPLAFVALALAALGLVACGGGEETTDVEGPVTIEAAQGTNPAVVHLTAMAVKRIDLQTGLVEMKSVAARPSASAPAAAGSTVATAGVPAGTAPGDTEAPKTKPATKAPATTAPPPPPPTTAPMAAPRLALPFAAVLYQPSGDAFVYVDRGDRSFVRAPVVVDYVVADVAVLTSGPPPGTAVVTVGATQVLGAEAGVGDEELG